VDILQRIYRWALNLSSDSPQVFWLMGQAGSGKSTIAYTVTDHFGNVEDDNSDLKYILGANFFCSRQFENETTDTHHPHHRIPARRSRSYAGAFLNWADKSDSVDDPTKQMKELLVGPWQQSAGESPRELRPYLIVVDALDEIEDNEGLAFLQELLETFRKGHLRGLKFLVTSRPDPELTALYSSFEYDAACHLYDVSMDTVKADIMTYLKEKLPALQGNPKLAELSQKADGLFIYAATAVRYIRRRDKMTRHEQLNMFAHCDTPSLIDTLYQQILWGAFCNLPDARCPGS